MELDWIKGFRKVEDESGTCNDCCFNKVSRYVTKCTCGEHIPDAPEYACWGGYFISDVTEHETKDD